MAYTPTEWNCGDTITAEKLNKLENGLAECCGGGTEVIDVKIVTSYANVVSVDHSAQEIFQALQNKQQVRLLWQTGAWDDSHSYNILYLRAYSRELTYDENNYGSGYRFQTLTYDDNGSWTAFGMDVIDMLDEGNYYWVFQNSPSGKHE